MATTNLSDYSAESLPNASGFRVAVITAEWNEEITSGLKQGALALLTEAGVSTDNIIEVSVPGSYELPQGADMALRNTRIDAAICLGSVIRGETAHFDYVCSAAAHGVQNVALKTGRPVIFGILTDDNIDQARARSGGALGNKGTEAAVTALKMIALNRLHDGSQRSRLGF